MNLPLLIDIYSCQLLGFIHDIYMFVQWWKTVRFYNEKNPPNVRSTSTYCNHHSVKIGQVAMTWDPFDWHQCSLIVNLISRNKLQGNMNRNISAIIHGNAYKTVVRKLAAIVCKAWCMKFIIKQRFIIFSTAMITIKTIYTSRIMSASDQRFIFLSTLVPEIL